MKKGINIILLLCIATVGGFILRKNINNMDTLGALNTEQPFIATIEQKRIIPGNLYPLSEIEINSPISGTLDKVFVKVGDKVKIGDKIAQIKLVPDPSRLESAKSTLNSATISFENQQSIYRRNKNLFQEGIIAAAEFEEHQKAFKLSEEQYILAHNQLTLIQDGIVKNTERYNIVKATAAGTIIDLPLKEGASVIERNNFNSGTAIAVVARLDMFIYRCKVSESDIAYMYQGMKLTLHLNAYRDQVREALLDKVSAKGIEEQGIMKYYIEARLDMSEDSLVIRSGYSANAEIILQRHQDVLAIKEEHLEFQNDSAYLTTITANGIEEKRFVTTGLSDGFDIEIVQGLNKDDKYIIKQK